SGSGDVHAPPDLELVHGVGGVALADAGAADLARVRAPALLVDGDRRARLGADEPLDLGLLPRRALRVRGWLVVVAVARALAGAHHVALQLDLLGQHGLRRAFHRQPHALDVDRTVEGHVFDVARPVPLPD